MDKVRELKGCSSVARVEQRETRDPRTPNHPRISLTLNPGYEAFQFVFAGATWCPGKPARSMACCTNPEALACSINSLM